MPNENELITEAVSLYPIFWLLEAESSMYKVVFNNSEENVKIIIMHRQYLCYCLLCFSLMQNVYLVSLSPFR